MDLIDSCNVTGKQHWLLYWLKIFMPDKQRIFIHIKIWCWDGILRFIIWTIPECSKYALTWQAYGKDLYALCLGFWLVDLFIYLVTTVWPSEVCVLRLYCDRWREGSNSGGSSFHISNVYRNIVGKELNCYVLWFMIPTIEL